MKQFKAGDIVKSSGGEFYMIISTETDPKRHHLVWLVSCVSGHKVRLRDNVLSPESSVMSKSNGELICNLHDIITVWQKEEH